MGDIKCIHCVEAYIGLSDEEKEAIHKEGTFDAVVRSAVTFVPSWQLNSFAPGQMAAACVTLAVCLDHIVVKKPDATQIAHRSGLAIPGTPGFN